MYFSASFDDLKKGHYELNYSITVYNETDIANASVVEGGEDLQTGGI